MKLAEITLPRGVIALRLLNDHGDPFTVSVTRDQAVCLAADLLDAVVPKR